MNDSEVLLRILLAAFCGALLGLERQIHGRPAGLRTHILVSTGAALMTLAGMHAMKGFGDGIAFPDYVPDPTRLAAGIVTGIGFIGAGAILRTRDMIRGLTTAACIWIAAGVGLASAFGMTVPVVAVTLFSLVVLSVFSVLEDHLPRHRQRDLKLVCGSGPTPSAMAERVSGILAGRGLRCSDIEMDVSERCFVLVFRLHYFKRLDLIELLEEISSLDGVSSVSSLEQTTEL
ncbi:MAG TPA: MgtC/SapB family protein [Candidatus Fermentibacter daniensis]|jgi:putative Mg2+ transporter-C (MgtC) family protein|nr:MAG: hypothetical protein AO396_04455 [Candidatus Fermentibacter daniensis]MBP7719961.1 MgtC/SapB family protein [Candidatus Fermentibacter sp.]KZD16609.1 MAG: hypothetical protein AO394_06775 [Candidatus Fermentibacter daniensis]KZD18214.1 MAG: hypothetical protein AO395_01050 [Candidatus Fermentibacter daniensis]MCC6870955.1 MgtC/SapB family protein [Candidatus Fermentibacter sp.]